MFRFSQQLRWASAMHLKRYEIVNIGDAITQIKHDLGPDTIILSTRTLRKRSGLFSLVGKPLLEVIAAADPQSLHASPPAADKMLHGPDLTGSCPTPVPPFSPASLPSETAPTELEALRQELRSMREQLQTLQGKGGGESPSVPKARSLPKSLMHLHQQLMTKGIAADLASQLLAEVRAGRPARALGEEAKLQEALKDAMLRRVQVLGSRGGQGSAPSWRPWPP
jgi:flagellar biosynthesis GTPase FlhF